LAFGIFIGFLLLIGVRTSALFHLRPIANQEFSDYPMSVVLHVILGGAVHGVDSTG
jgi:hypothetical protein